MVTVSFATKADEISEEQALHIAAEFASLQIRHQFAFGTLPKATVPRSACSPTLAHSTKSVTDGRDNVYVVNLGAESGFVIVSANSDTDGQVLGYCDHGSFCYEEAPVQLKDLLQVYSDGVDLVRSGSIRASVPSVLLGSIEVGPLLTTSWNQWAPYNNLCPTGCPTGCYPTALAQIMNYWKWPKESKGMVDDVDFSGHVYDWDNMLDQYGQTWDYAEYYPYNAAQSEAVAHLMADIGTAFHTSYFPTGSPTSANVIQLAENFGYEPDIQKHTAQKAALLVNVMRGELKQERPILYVGDDGEDGVPHALVCDGYTSGDYFHFNFGWGGHYDGYYKNAACSYYSCNCTVYTGIRPYDAEEYVSDDISYKLLPDGTAHIMRYNRSSESGITLTLPATVTDANNKTYKVVRIRKNAFSTSCSFKKIVIGENIEDIDKFAFINCTIDTLIIGDKTHAISDEAFQTTGVKYLTIGAGVTHIGKKAFMMCNLTEVTSKSPAFDVDDYAFYYTRPSSVEWLGSITSLGECAFGAVTFKDVPHFDKLTDIGPKAFASVTFPESKFIVPATLRHIDPTAFNSSGLYSFEVEDANPYFSQKSGILYNKDQSSLVLTPLPNMDLGDNLMPFPQNLVRMEPGSITSRKSRWDTFRVIIPNTVEEVTGAFSNCENISDLVCLATEPPFATDDSFNDKILDTPLYVPEGCYESYAQAPGWRRFSKIIANRLYEPASLSSDREYQMVIHRSALDNLRLPIAGIIDMQTEPTATSYQLVISQKGKDEIRTDVQDIDSINLEKSAVLSSTQVFDLDPDHLTAQSQNCKIRLGETVIDGGVQLMVRNSVLTPNVVEGCSHGVAFDISLSTGEHNLKGVATITVPFSPKDGERVQAAYFNEQTSTWDPVFFTYDEQRQEAVIITNHLSLFSVFGTNDNIEDSRFMKLTPLYWEYKAYSGLNDACLALLEVISSDNPDVQAIMKWKDDYSFWQSVGIDGGYNLLSSLGFTTDAVSNAVDVVGYLGTAMSTLDVIAADIKGDDTGVASNTLKTVLGFATGQMSSAIGTGIMSASMGLTAFIGVAIEKFGTMVSEAKLDYARAMYRYYYSEKGWEECAPQSRFGGKYRRDAKAWYDYFYPAFEKPMTELQLRSYIEQVVRRYCDQFWEESDAVQTYCENESKRLGFSSFMYITESEKQQICDEYFAELMNGVLVSVFQNIKSNLAVQSEMRMKKALEDYTTQVNTKVGIRFTDSSWKEGVDASKFAGWTVRFSEMPLVSDPEHWTCTLDEKGKGALGYFTEYSIITNKVKCSLTLVNPEGEDINKYDFKIPAGTGKILIDIDLATAGTAIDAPHLEGLELQYDPAIIESSYTMDGTFSGATQSHSTTPNAFIALDNTFNQKARFQTELERFFKRHSFITVDASGHIKIGDDIVGEFENNGLEGHGTFTIDTTSSFEEKTIDSYAAAWASVKDDTDMTYLFYNLLDGNIRHIIECSFTVTRSQDGKEYKIDYSGMGTYIFTANVVDHVSGIDYDEFPYSVKLTSDDITTRQINSEGTVQLSYTKLLHNQ